MGLRDLEIKNEYRTNCEDVPRDFLVPVLSEAVLYKRAVAYFSSSALAEVAQGIGRIAKRGGKIQLIASPDLSKEDVDAIEQGYERREEVQERVIKERLFASLADVETLSNRDRDRLNLLANLIAAGTLDIRIAFNSKGYGIYHEKLGIIIDEMGDKIAFTGSMNETGAAMTLNIEVVDVYKSWDDPQGRFPPKESHFDAIWENHEPNVATYDFPEVKDEIVRRYRDKDKRPDYTDDLLDVKPDFVWEPSQNYRYPKMPDTYTLRSYQLEAIDNWEKQNYRGIYDMATGTGKTVTALASIVRLSERLKNNLAVVIVCPYQHLVEQWVEDIELFNIRPIIGYSSSSQKDWYNRLQVAILNQKVRVKGASFFCFICTNATYASEKVQEQLDRIKCPKLLVVDEAHNFGADYLRSLLRDDFQFRLALSATMERYGDPEGTKALFSYFGDRCIEYTLEEAIYGRGEEPPCLTPYRYHPIVVYLEKDELEEYADLSIQIAQAIRMEKNGKKKLTERGKMLALKRARLVAAARQKLPALKKAITPYKDDKYILVYCGATKIQIDGDSLAGVDDQDTNDFEARQIDAVTHLLGDDLDMRVRQFTSRENSKEREEIKELFEDGDIQTLIAIKCLDEGVNIPMIQTAFILASTTNPREYIQRRGRLLRKDKNGLKDRAQIYDFITLPRTSKEAAMLPEEAMPGEKRLVYNELVRAKEFADLAENRSEVNRLLDEIEEGFFGYIGGIEKYQGEETDRA